MKLQRPQGVCKIFDSCNPILFTQKCQPKSILQLFVNKQPSHSLPRTNTHTRQQDLLLLPPALAQSRNDLSCTRSAQWVTKRNRSSSGVHLLVWQLENVFAVDGHGGKGLVDFDDVAVVDGDVEFCEELGDGDGGADTHDTRGKTGDGDADKFGEDGLAELDCTGAFHEEDGGS
jgi:hypothetical protein